jgi:hypothetical protein
VGLFFKEFLAIPLLLALADFFRAWRRERSRRALATLVVAAVVAVTVILVPRLGLHVVDTRQEIDPLNNIHSLSRLVMNPLNPGRDLNIVLGLLAFWLPVLLLLTRERVGILLRETAPFRKYIAAFLALNLLLTMYGGSNILTFVSYAMPIQILALALLARGGAASPRPAEWSLALVCAACYARIFGSIPLPDDGFETYVDYYSGWSSRVGLSTLLRFIEIGFYLALMIGLRAGLRRILSNDKSAARRIPGPIPSDYL